MSLARALYSDSDVYLLDDPLSAVDAIVGEHIFHKVIREYLKDKTVFLVTHHIHFAKLSDNIVLMDSGRILARGPYSELYKKYPEVFVKIMKEEEEQRMIAQDKKAANREKPLLAEQRRNSLLA